MGRYKPTLLQKLLRVVEHPAFEPPKAWSVLSRFPPAELSLQRRAPPAMEFSHNTFYQQLFAAYPEVRMSPYALNQRHPSLARRFVTRQLALMRGGMARPAAFRAVEAEMRPELGALKHEGEAGGFVGYVQAQEESVLQQAVRTLIKRQAMLGSGGGR
ncbi:hypothetical protein Rsub_02089 [Raphidocelis subcapitata]|uniref:Ribosomal protein S23 mitochondrial conserved domain-containing protein n=1 Tax=Raphidocelis subcapitata TaxID=307507 RepID=A0A2V0NX66_9CHLO|nr:hypothetical protein Rsub_02089 [Raphidocelis subcapitata]|eukprot:GBF89517.1 hypothetical protein Rsub_02089 [Raphidocelis subcapitata]